jgi:hypothetical protein
MPDNPLKSRDRFGNSYRRCLTLSCAVDFLDTQYTTKVLELMLFPIGITPAERSPWRSEFIALARTNEVEL